MTIITLRYAEVNGDQEDSEKVYINSTLKTD